MKLSIEEINRCIKIYTYLIERQMDDCSFDIPANYYFKIIDNKYPQDSEAIKYCIMYRLMNRYDAETITKREDEEGAQIHMAYARKMNKLKEASNIYNIKTKLKVLY